MKLEEHSQLGEQEETVAEEMAGKGNRGGGEVKTEFTEECRTLQSISMTGNGHHMCNHKGF